MISKKVIVKTNVGYSDDSTKRYFLDVSWDNSLPTATVIMQRPSKSNGVFYDQTVNNALELLYNNGYGRVYFVNLFCSQYELEQDYPENWQYIRDCIRQSSDFMLFFGMLSKPDDSKSKNSEPKNSEPKNSEPKNSESNYEEVKSVILKKLADILKQFKNQGKPLRYYVLLDKNGKMYMPTLPGGEIHERSYDEILEILGEKRESGDNGQK